MPSKKYQKIVGTSYAAVSRRHGRSPRPGAAILVVTEGANTERIYFDQVKRLFVAQTVELVTIGAGINDPEDLTKLALQIRKERRRRARVGDLGLNELPDFDELWIVFDTDVLEPEQLRRGLAYAQQMGVKVASSEPCFEYWMLLHSATGYTTRLMPTCVDVIPQLCRAFDWPGYSKSREEARGLIEPLVTKERVNEAVRASARVREHHRRADTRAPANPSTEVDFLMRAIDAAVGKANKFLDAR